MRVSLTWCGIADFWTEITAEGEMNMVDEKSEILMGELDGVIFATGIKEQQTGIYIQQ